MLEVIIPEDEFYDQSTNKFITIPSCKIVIEHSLISVAKWESKWHMPYLSDSPRSPIQELDYIKCMIIGSIPNDLTLKTLSAENIKLIRDYINNPMTATTFQKNSKSTGRGKKENTTAETIYAHMFAHSIPIDCQKWHLNRLLTLLRVCDLKNSPRDKMTKKQTAMWNAEQNALRKAKYNTRG